MEKEFKNLLGKDVIALGAEMKGSFVAVKDGKVVGSEVFESLSDYDEFEKYKSRLRFVIEKYSIVPTAIICDMHPEYVTTGLASELVLEFKCDLIRVQHHIAHAYSAAHEHNLTDFGSIVCDGLGYGLDGKIWEERYF